MLFPSLPPLEVFSQWFADSFSAVLPLPVSPSLEVFAGGYAQFLCKQSREVRRFQKFSTEFNKSLLGSRKVR